VLPLGWQLHRLIQINARRDQQLRFHNELDRPERNCGKAWQKKPNPHRVWQRYGSWFEPVVPEYGRGHAIGVGGVERGKVPCPDRDDDFTTDLSEAR